MAAQQSTQWKWTNEANLLKINTQKMNAIKYSYYFWFLSRNSIAVDNRCPYYSIWSFVWFIWIQLHFGKKEFKLRFGRMNWAGNAVFVLNKISFKRWNNFLSPNWITWGMINVSDQLTIFPSNALHFWSFQSLRQRHHSKGIAKQKSPTPMNSINKSIFV